MNNIKKVYVAGKYSGNTKDEVSSNIYKAEMVARKLWKVGFYVFCPHKNSEHFDNEAPYGHFLKGYLEFLKSCDVLFLLNNWKNSSGAKEEYETAIKHGLKIFDDINELIEWGERYEFVFKQQDWV